MAAMFLSRVDLFPEEAMRSRGHVLLPLCRLQSIWPGLTPNEVLGREAGAPGGGVHIRDQRERRREGRGGYGEMRANADGTSRKVEFWNRSKTHTGYRLTSRHIHHRTVMLGKCVCVSVFSQETV